MSNFNYTNTQTTADRLIARFGATATLRRSETTGGNAWDPGSGTTVTTDYSVTAVVLEYANRDIDGSLVQQGDKRVYVSAKGLPAIPAVTDTLVIDGTTYRIIGVKPLRPAAVTVLYDVQARV